MRRIAKTIVALTTWQTLKPKPIHLFTMKTTFSNFYFAYAPKHILTLLRWLFSHTHTHTHNPTKLTANSNGCLKNKMAIRSSFVVYVLLYFRHPQMAQQSTRNGFCRFTFIFSLSFFLRHHVFLFVYCFFCGSIFPVHLVCISDLMRFLHTDCVASKQRR